MSSVSVAVLAFEGISLFHLSVPGVVLNPDNTPEKSHYDLRYFAVQPGPLRSDQGVTLHVPAGLEEIDRAEIIIIPAWSAPEERAPAALTEALSRANRQGKLIVGLCLGAFVLGDAGLLDGKEATTHWIARDAFSRRFPKSIFRPDVLYIADENVVTSAGTVAAIDCCLNLLRQRHGSEAANHVARMLVTPPHRPGGQAQYIERPLPRQTEDASIPTVLEWARAHLSSPLSLDILAQAANMTRRTFTRRFREATGMTVTQWLNAERVAKAQYLLETTDLSIEHITSEVGFGTPLSLRQQFSRQLGTSPSTYRRDFYRADGPAKGRE